MTTINTENGFIAIVELVRKNGWEVTNRHREVAAEGETIKDTTTLVVWDQIDWTRTMKQGSHRIVTNLTAFYAKHTDGTRRLQLDARARTYTDLEECGDAVIDYNLIVDLREELHGMVNSVFFTLSNMAMVPACTIEHETLVEDDKIKSYDITVLHERCWMVQEQIAFLDTAEKAEEDV